MTFLNRNLNEDVYMTQPKGFVDPKHTGKRCKLQKSIYGLKQTSQSWNMRFDKVVKGFGFIKNVEESYVYKKDSRCDRTTSENEAFISQYHIGGFSTKWECINTTHKHTII
jgi:hypothetical protein